MEAKQERRTDNFMMKPKVKFLRDKSGRIVGLSVLFRSATVGWGLVFHQGVVAVVRFQPASVWWW